MLFEGKRLLQQLLISVTRGGSATCFVDLLDQYLPLMVFH